MHFSGRVKNLVSHFLSVSAGVRGVVLFALMFCTGMGNVWGETYSSDKTITSSNFAAGDTITINSNATLTINLMGQDVTVNTIYIGSGGSAGNLLINGPGTLNVGTFDPDEKVKNRIEINNYANLVVTGTFYADKKDGADAVTIITGDRTGSLSISDTGKVDYYDKNDSGVFFDTVNVNVLSDIDNLVKYSWDSIKASISEGIGITVKRTFKGQAKNEKIFYKVDFSNPTRADINGFVVFDKDSSENESKTVSKDILISFNTDPSGFENTGDSAILTLYAPDGVTELATVAYYYQRPVWNGSKSTDGYDVENWGLAAETAESELLELFKSNQIVLNSGLPRYPVFGVAEKSVEFNSLVVSSGASVTVSAGELIAGELSVKGSGVLNTNGGKLTISGDSTISNLNLGSEMKVTGGTTVITSLKTNRVCSVEISSGAEVSVTNSYLGENCSGKLSWTGTGTLTIPRSGANVDFGAKGPDYGAKLDVKAAGAATYYSANDLTADGNLILTRVSGSSTGTVAVEYPYTLSTDSTNPVTIDENTYNKTSGTSGKLVVPKEVTSKSFTVSGLSGINSGCSFIMTIYSPDGKFSLGSISYTKTSSAKIIYWNGSRDSYWCNNDNWTSSDGVAVNTDSDSWKEYDLVVGPTAKDGTKITRFPNVNNTNTAKSVTILSGAHVTMGIGTELTIGDIKCMGDAYFSATQGTVNFSDGASFTAANPDNSKFNNVKISGKFTVNSKMSVAKNFSAEGLGGKTITLNDNVIVGGNLFLSGTETGPGVVEMLSVEGGAGNYFKISNTQNYGMYLKVADGLKIGENGGTSSVVYKAYNCDKYSAADKDPLGWVLSKEAPNEFIWTGLNSTEWANIENWSPKKIPGEADVIIIPDGLTNYPKLPEKKIIKSIRIGEKEGSNAKIELNGFGFKVTGTTAGAFTNYGTVVCIKNELDNVVMPAESGAVVENGTWQFNGNGATVKKIENHTYKNILISNQTNISGDITAEKITINTESKHSITSSVKITADVVLKTDSQFDTSGTNDFTITGNISGGKSLEILSSGTFKLTGSADVGNFYAQGNAVFAGNLTASGTISVDGTTQFEGNEISISSGGTQKFNGKVTVDSDVKLVAGTLGAPSSVIFNSTVDDGATSDSDRHSIVIDSPSVEFSAVFNGTVGGTSKLKNLQVNGSASGNGADPIVINSENSSFAAFENGTNLTVNGNADIYGNNKFTSFTLTGNADIYGDNTFTSFTLTGNAVIYGLNTFTNIVIDNSGATAETTVKFGNGTTQTIQNDWSGGNIPFKGAGEGKELVLTSIEPFISETPNPWNVVFTNSDISNKNFSYVKVQNSKSVNSIASAKPLNLLQKKENVVSAGNTFDWFRKTIYKWLGTEDTKWNNKDNWKDENNSPVSDVPDYATGTNEIIIDEASVNSLVFDVDGGIPEGTELKLKSLKIPSSKKVCIADCCVTADSITVDGTIALFGTQTKYPLGVNGGNVDWGANSTIEYYGSSSGAKDILYASVDSETETRKYQNIKLSCGSILFEKALDVAGNFTNDSAGQITFAKNVKAASPVNFASSVALSGNVIFDVPAVTFKSAFNAGLISEDSAREIVFTGNVSSEGKFTAAAGITEFKGNVDFSGSNFIHNGGTVKISGTDNLLTVKTDGSAVFNNLTANSSKTTLNGAFSVIRDFLVETDVECEMNGALTISGNFTNNGTFKAGKSDSDSYELKIAKDFVNNGSFDAKSGTVLFTGTENSNISGETKWFNFKAETPGKTLIFQAGKIQEILNSLTITGSASDDKSSNVVLKSSTDGEFWFIKTAVNDSNLSVDYASIKDSKCTEKSIVANNSDDLGNTSGWIFPGLLYTWVGNESDLWSVSKNWSPASLPGKLSRVLIPDGKVIKADMDIEIQKLDLKPKSTFDLASHKITINGSDNYLTNEGTIKLNGIENQVEAAVKNLPDSWIEYYGGTAENPSKNVIKEEYYNLKIYSDADFDNLSDNTDIPVIINGNLVLAESASVFNNLTTNSSKATLNGAFSVIRDFLVETDVECEMNGALTISGNFTNNGTFKAGKSDSDSYELKIAKDFVNNGSFDAKSGTVLFTGTENSNISGETKWFNFKAETPGKTLIFQAGKIQEILNSLTITGSASDDKSSNVVLKSSTDGEFWFIKTAVNDSNLSVDYASIKDSKCTEKSIVANNSDDLGNTSGWIFPGLLYTWVGNESDLWSVSKNWSPASLPGKLSRVLIPDGKVIKADMDIEIQKLDLKPKSTFDLASHKITINGSDNYLTNEGTIKLNGIENQVEAAVKNLPDSWIEYYGGTAENPSKNVIKEEYYNLKIYSDADFDNLSDNTDVPVIINGNLVLAESARMTFEKNVQICGDLIENGNNLVLKGNFEVANVQSENGKHISITFNGPVAGKTEQTLYYSSLSDKKSVNIQNLDIKNTKVVTNVSFNVYGKWNNNGEFTASDGTVKIVEGGTISGNNNFASFVFEKNGGKLSFEGKNSYKSLSIVAPGGEIKFAPGEENAQSVTESLVLKGSKDSLMLLSSLPSSRNASQWFINCSNSEAADMRFIKVFDSYANKATSARLVALESRNGGNNINWQFPGLAIALTAAAIGQNQMYIVFDRAIDIAKSKLENTLYFINSEGSLLSDLKIQKATAIHDSTESTGFACSLSRTIQFEDILNVYVIYRSDGENYIATPTSDFMTDNESHALSDFAVNAVEPLYAYDNRQASLNSDYFKTGINIEESLAVHDWNEEQQKNGSLIYNSDIFIKVRKNYSTRLENSDKTTEKISLYFDTEPDKDASSAYYNSIFGEKLRVWLPSVTSEGKSVLPIEMMARKNNVPKGTLTAESENSEFKYNFNNDSLSMSNGINSGDQVKFIFGLEDREICRVPIVTGDLSGFTVDASNKSPLFALRLKNSRDISSLDLWSFRLKEITSQRGGVTILNNVIDTSRGDIATVKVDMSGSGSLSVIVMTLDGNVVQYLQHGTASGGEHYYSWNGKTKGGKNVARGMYFVRVIGSGFDETRKIMVVRE